MTINDPPPYGPTQPPNYDQPKKKKKSKTPWIIGGIVGVALCCGGVGVAALNSDSGKQGFKDGSSSAKPVVTSAKPSDPKPQPVATKGAHVPTTKDIVLKIKVTKKQCFGSAGCLVDFRIDSLTYGGDDMDKSKTYEVIYEVKGLKDPYTNTLTLNGDGSFEYQKEESGQTSTTKVALKAVVTSVDAL